MLAKRQQGTCNLEITCSAISRERLPAWTSFWMTARSGEAGSVQKRLTRDGTTFQAFQQGRARQGRYFGRFMNKVWVAFSAITLDWRSIGLPHRSAIDLRMALASDAPYWVSAPQ